MHPALILLALTCVQLPRAAAEPQLTPEQRERAKQHFERGKDLYSRAYYEAAALEYRAAYRLMPLPELLFNVGQAFRLGKKDADAIRAYEMFLSMVPDGDLADEARAHVLHLRQQGDERGTRTVVADALDAPPSMIDSTVRPEEPPPRRFAIGLDLTKSGVTEGGSFTTYSATAKYVNQLRSWASFEPRVLAGFRLGAVGDGFGMTQDTTLFNGSFALEAQARVMFYPGIPWLFVGPGIGLGVSSCATASTESCSFGTIGSLFVEVGLLVSGRYEVSLLAHPVSLGANNEYSPFGISVAYRF